MATDVLKHGMNCAGLIPGREDECTCGLRWRIALQTEQTMHQAWRKRAEEAEQALAAKERECGELAAEIEELGQARCRACIEAERTQIACVQCGGAFTNYDELCHGCSATLRSRLDVAEGRAMKAEWRLQHYCPWDGCGEEHHSYDDAQWEAEARKNREGGQSKP